ncbi:MAG: bifunctional adenosylcobinamide kinase/adenosylcobinamide-phosphate guanylyltransferase [Filifactor alocis]|nr:bifunctional adenosylcobinamide kinase/adenosylcobinamide-phosphate guanylyltransferase [Filifactor alocis]
MGRIVLVTGGARSGKSLYAEELCRKNVGSVAYIATAEIRDSEMQDRVRKHRAQRPSDWTTYECWREISPVLPSIVSKDKTILLDCLTMLVSNLMFAQPYIDYETAEMEAVNRREEDIGREVDSILSIVRGSDSTLVVVTNELGMGIVPQNRLSRLYRDIIGRMNQRIGSRADEVYFLVSGIAMNIKKDGEVCE